MRIRLDYGKSGLEVELPDENVVGLLEQKPVAPLGHASAALTESLHKPIGCATAAGAGKGTEKVHAFSFAT